MKNKAVKLRVALVILSLVLVNLSAFTSSLHGQQKTPIKVEFFVPITSKPNAFITIWDTTQIGISYSDQVSIPLESNGTYNFLVDWGDMSNDTITKWNQSEVTHTYASQGIYTITITGTIIGWRFNNGGDKNKILEIKQWGCLRLGNSGSYFYGCSNLAHTATDNLNLTGTTSLYYAFAQCFDLGSSGNMNGWDVSSVTDMSSMFERTSSFNQPIGDWDVSSVTDMSSMFYRASSFNRPIGNWNVSSVTDMTSMFFYAWDFNQSIGSWDVSRVTSMTSMFYQVYGFNHPIGDWDVSRVRSMNSMFYQAYSFNQPIGSWNVSSVTNMEQMFGYASSFNQPIDDWDVLNVISMNGIFAGASSFNQPIGNWDVSNVKSMSGMFSPSSFNQPIGGWDVSSVTSMNGMFSDASSFNQPIGNWDVSSVTSMVNMFYGAYKFNQPIGDWNVSNVIYMYYMFEKASSFNQHIGDWDVSNVKSMSGMFSETPFNQPIGGWDVSSVISMVNMFYFAPSFNQPIGGWNVSSVTNMRHMFYYASSFNQPLGNWNVSSVTDMYEMFYGVTLSTLNYDNLLLGWSQLPLQTGVDFHAGYSKYGNAAKDARQAIITDFSWIITDGGFVPTPEIFILSSNAGTPDTDGSFTLTWTSANGANYYSVYQYSGYITEINGSLTPLVEEISDLSLPLSGYSDGTYYFIVVAYNTYGETLSNCVKIDVVITKSLTIISPNASSSWEINTAQYIYWNSKGSISNVRIEIHKDGVFVMEIIASTLNDGSYTWSIPKDLEEGIGYQIKISDVSDPETYDFSDYFEIKKPSKDSPGIPGYDLYLLISTICIISVLLFKNRFKLIK